MSCRAICEECGQYQKGDVYLTGQNQDQDTFICNSCIEGEDECPPTLPSPVMPIVLTYEQKVAAMIKSVFGDT